MSAAEEATGTVAAAEVEENLSPEEAQARLQALNQVCQELTRKINELDMDRTEHGLVIDALKPLDSGRKCFRMVGDVVVERTIAEVAPAVLKNRDAIVETMNKMGEAQPALSKCPGSQRPHATTHCPRSLLVAQGYPLGSERRTPAAWMPKRGRPRPRLPAPQLPAPQLPISPPLATQALAQKQQYADEFAAKYKVSAQNLQPAAAESGGDAGGSQGVLI